MDTRVYVFPSTLTVCLNDYRGEQSNEREKFWMLAQLRTLFSVSGFYYDQCIAC